MSDNAKKVGLIGLIGIVFTSMVGSSVYNLPQNMAASASAGAVLLAWIVTAVGMFFLAQTFRTLSEERPDITSGIYAYAKEGFGNYMGFNSAWGYWVSGAMGNVAFAVLLNDAVGYFYPPMLDHGLLTIIFSLVFIWFFTFVVFYGVEFATKISAASTVIVLLVMVTIIVLLIYGFHWDKFVSNFWGEGLNIGGLNTQVKSTMMVTLWSFIGIEGAVVIAGRAKKSKDVGTATVIGFFSAWVIYALISLMSFGIESQPELSALKAPSAGYILQVVAGDWANAFVNISVIVSLLISWLAWTVLVAEVPYDAANEGVLPKIFKRENRKKSPVAALVITAILMTFMVFLVIVANDVYMAAISIASVMILPPYFFSSAYLWEAADKSDILKDKYRKRMRALGIGIIATLYSAWLLYAAGLNYLLMSSIFYAIGIPFYYKARQAELKKGEPAFTRTERRIGFVIIILAAVSIYMMLDKGVQ